MRSVLALVGDIGGTNARFALSDLAGGGGLIAPRSYPCAEVASLEDAIEDYLKSAGATPRPATAMIAVAGPVTDGAITFTNGGWTLSEAGLGRRGFVSAKLINDFAALALAAGRLGGADVVDLGPGHSSHPGDSIAVVGAGTGFGAAALVRDGRAEMATATEGGHVSFAPVDEVEIEILSILARRFGRVSLERLLSGVGLQNLYGALAEISGRPDLAEAAPEPATITARALAGDDALCVQAVERFCAILGSAAGDFALAYGARGGVYVAGGVAPRILPLLQVSRFRERFEAKGRFKDYMATIPTRVVVHPFAALLGAERAIRMAETTRIG